MCLQCRGLSAVRLLTPIIRKTNFLPNLPAELLPADCLTALRNDLQSLDKEPNLNLHPHLLLMLSFLQVNLLFARSFSVVPFRTKTWSEYSWLESSPATVARPLVVVSISSGCCSSRKENNDALSSQSFFTSHFLFMCFTLCCKICCLDLTWRSNPKSIDTLQSKNQTCPCKLTALNVTDRTVNGLNWALSSWKAPFPPPPNGPQTFSSCYKLRSVAQCEAVTLHR